MDYKDINDNELLMMINESSEDAKNAIYYKYNYIVKIYVKKYEKIAYVLGMDIKDLNQEALVGFSDAINNYNVDENASLKTFISLCVERRIQVSLLKASRKKNQILNDALSLEHIYTKFDNTLADIISDNDENNPLTKITRNEQFDSLFKEITSSLSASEKDVFNLMLNGFDYKQIATILNFDTKVVDNAIQRIKNKVKLILTSYEVNI